MSMNLSWIDDFMVLAATGNFSRAAEERHMTQPAFSRRIRALEEWLGTDLFDRSTHPARLTEAGQWFRKVAQDLQASVARIPGEARAIADASSATLRFAATHVVSFNFMPRWLRSVEERASVGPVQLDSDVQQKCEALLMQRQVQFMLAHSHPSVPGAMDESAFPSLVVGSDQLIPVAAADEKGAPLHRLPARTRGAVTQFLGYSAESGLGRILQHLKGPALERLHVQNVFTAHLASVLRTMALDGRGLAWLPHLLVGDDIDSGRLVIAAPDEWHINLEIRLYRHGDAIGNAAEQFWRAAGEVAGGVRVSSTIRSHAVKHRPH